jgi:hypothetical protein
MRTNSATLQPKIERPTLPKPRTQKRTPGAQPMSLKQLTQQQPSKLGHLDNLLKSCPRVRTSWPSGPPEGQTIPDCQLSFVLHLQPRPNLATIRHQSREPATTATSPPTFTPDCAPTCASPRAHKPTIRKSTPFPGQKTGVSQFPAL